jgi:hypothetical protein
MRDVTRKGHQRAATSWLRSSESASGLGEEFGNRRPLQLSLVPNEMHWPEVVILAEALKRVYAMKIEFQVQQNADKCDDKISTIYSVVRIRGE